MDCGPRRLLYPYVVNLLKKVKGIYCIALNGTIVTELYGASPALQDYTSVTCQAPPPDTTAGWGEGGARSLVSGDR